MHRILCLTILILCIPIYELAAPYSNAALFI